jgi:thiazole tautomerase (transcriptional regulator TenI)
VKQRTVPRLHLVGPLGVVPAERFVEIAVAAVQGGCDSVHLRLPGARTSELLPIARDLRQQLTDTTLFVNDRPDIALIAGFEGVQLPEAGFSAGEARGIAGNHVLIGRSVHDPASARHAVEDGVDFVLAGHVFDTDSKAGTPGRGPEWLRGIVDGTSLPVVAIGGITVERIRAVLAAGAYGIALGRELLLADDPAAVACAARTAMDRYDEGKINHAAD